MRAVALNRREFGNQRYDLLRSDPEFEPWIGSSTGETGRKRLQRMVNKVREPLPHDRTKPHQYRDLNEEQHAWANVETAEANAQSSLPLRLTPSQVMAGGGAALTGFAALQDLIANGPEDLQRIRAAALVEDRSAPGGLRALDPKLLLKTVVASADFAKKVADLQRDYNSIFPTVAFAEGVMRIALEAAGDDREARRAVATNLGSLVQQLNGLSPGESKP